MGARLGASQVMASSPGLGLVSVTPVISLSAAWTVEPAWKRNGTASSRAATRTSCAGQGFFRSRPCRELLAGGLFARVECCVMVGFLLRAWCRRWGQPGRAPRRGRTLPHWRCDRSRVFLDSRLRGMAGRPRLWASPRASGPDAGPPLSVAARGGPAHVLGNIWASVGWQTSTVSPIGQTAKECGICLRCSER